MIITMMALIMVAVIIAATNPEVLVCARHSQEVFLCYYYFLRGVIQ